LVVAVLAGLAGLILVGSSFSLMDDLRRFADGARTEAIIGLAVVLGASAVCFFEAYRFYRFFASPEVRDRYYARTLRRSKVDKS